MGISVDIPSPSTLMVILLVVFLIFYLYLQHKLKYWARRNVFHIRPSFLIGNIGSLLRLEENEAELYDKLYKAMGDRDYAGSYYFWKPVLLVKDYELIKTITVKDFSSFSNHPGISDFSSTDKIVFSLFTMNGALWKDRRSKFVSHFSLKKIKDSFKSTVLISESVIPFIDKESGKDIELQALVSRYAMSIILNLLVSVRADTEDNPDSIFLKCGHLVTDPPKSTVIKILLYTLFPKVYTMLGLQSLSPQVQDMFSAVVQKMLELRNDINVNVDDIMDTLMKLHKNSDMSIDEVAGHLFSFFEAGYDSTTITTSYALYEISKNSELQKRLKKELDTAYVDGVLNYESLQSLQLLENILKETLRLYPPSGVIKRECNSAYSIEGLTIPQGMTVLIPVHSLHRDPDFYPEPEKFNPDRNFSSLSPFLPFGMGPRICIGMKMAELSVKVGLATILRTYEVLPPENHQHYVEFDPKTIFITVRPKNGIWVQLKRRVSLI